MKKSFLSPNQTVSNRRITSKSVNEYCLDSMNLGYKNKKAKNYFATPPSTKVIGMKPATGNNLGPGKYQIKSHSPSPSFEFNRTPRFSEQNILSFATLFKKISEKEKEQIKQRIEINKNSASLSRSIKQKIAKEKYKKKSIQSSITRFSKRCIDIEKKMYNENILKEKFKKFEYRMRLKVRNMKEVLQVRKSWIILNFSFGIPTIVKALLIHQKKLKEKSKKLRNWFRQISKCIGKLLRLHKRKKFARATKVIFIQKIKIYLMPWVMVWVQRKQKENKKMVLMIIEKKLSSSLLIDLVHEWKSKILYIQRGLKSALFYKMSLYESLLFRWNQAEHNIQEPSKNKVQRRSRRTISLRTLKQRSVKESYSSVPIDIKLYCLRKYIRNIFKKYFYDYKSYRTEFETVHKQNYKNRWINQSHVKLDYPVPPIKPNIYEIFTFNVFSELIQEALQRQAEWPGILSSQHNLFSKSNFK